MSSLQLDRCKIHSRSQYKPAHTHAKTLTCAIIWLKAPSVVPRVVVAIPIILIRAGRLGIVSWVESSVRNTRMEKFTLPKHFESNWFYSDHNASHKAVLSAERCFSYTSHPKFKLPWCSLGLINKKKKGKWEQEWLTQTVLSMHRLLYFCCGLGQWNLPHALGRKSSPSPSRATCK